MINSYYLFILFLFFPVKYSFVGIFFFFFNPLAKKKIHGLAGLWLGLGSGPGTEKKKPPVGGLHHPIIMLISFINISSR